MIQRSKRRIIKCSVNSQRKCLPDMGKWLNYGSMAHKYLTRDGWDKLYISRTDQIGPNSSTEIILFMRSDNAVFQNRGKFIIRIR